MQTRNYTLLLTAIAALGGLLYGYDIGIIGTALLYLDKCIPMTENQVGLLASAIMIGALASSIVGGGFCRSFRPKKSHGHLGPAVRAKRGVDRHGARILAAVLRAHAARPERGHDRRGGANFHVGMSAGQKSRNRSHHVPALHHAWASRFRCRPGHTINRACETAAKTMAGNCQEFLAVQDQAWRNMFLSSMYPAVIFFFVAMFVSESPRWLFRRGRRELARLACC